MTSYPLTDPQRRWWRLWFQGRPFRSSYFISQEIDGEFDVDRFASALRGIVYRHEALRCRARHRPDTELPDQVVLPAPDAAGLMDCRQVTGASPEQFTRYAGAVLREALLRPWTPDDDYPFRFVLLRHSPDRHAFFGVFSPLYVDGRSVEIINAELWRDYGATPVGDTSVGPVNPLIAASEPKERPVAPITRRYWLDRVDQLAEFVADQSGPVGHADPTNVTLTVDIAAAERAALDRRSAELGCTEFQLVLWTFLRHITAAYQPATLTIMTVVDSRGPNKGDAVGRFAGSLPLIMDGRAELSPQQLGRELILLLRHQNVPDDVLVRLSPLLDQVRGSGFGLPSVLHRQYAGDWLHARDAVGATVRPSLFRLLVNQTPGTIDMTMNSYHDRVRLHIGYQPDRVAPDVVKRITAGLRD
jgi:hypothetical protein